VLFFFADFMKDIFSSPDGEVIEKGAVSFLFDISWKTWLSCCK